MTSNSAQRRPASAVLARIPHIALDPRVPGVIVVALCAVGATFIGRAAPVLGAPVAGIVIGVGLSRVLARRGLMSAGIKFSSKFILQLAVVFLGAQLSLQKAATVGVEALPVMFGTLAVCLLLARWLGKRMGVDGQMTTLIGVGTAICGASAIAATSSVIKARESAIAYAVSTIFVFNIAAVLLFPPLGHLLDLSQHAFGIFAGTAVNDTSSVVATAAIYGDQASESAVVVKLTRSLMIIPIVLTLAWYTQRRSVRAQPVQSGSHWRAAVALVPWFLVGFLLLAAINSTGALSGQVQDGLRVTALFFITMAMTAIGMSTDFPALRRAGVKPMVLGGALWAAVTLSSLAIQFLMR